LGVVNNTLRAWIESENLYDTIIEGRNARLDFAESKLDQNINNGDTTAIIFLLKTLGKDRGYYDKSNFDHTSKGQPINIISLGHGTPPTDSETE
jgi:hypothetical protein